MNQESRYRPACVRDEFLIRERVKHETHREHIAAVSAAATFVYSFFFCFYWFALPPSRSVMSSPARSHRQPRWNFDIDRYINPFVVPARTATRRLPSLARRFLGHHDRPPRPLGNLLVIAWAVIGTLAALSLIYVVCRRITASQEGEVPVILGSFVRQVPTPSRPT